MDDCVGWAGLGDEGVMSPAGSSGEGLLAEGGGDGGVAVLADHPDQAEARAVGLGYII